MAPTEITGAPAARDDRPTEAATGRKADILRAATESFGQRGVKGTGLREIAAEAGVSLTLLSHHFGSKSMLLRAVVEAHHAVCRPGLGGLRALVVTFPASMTLDALVQAWIDYEFTLYDTPANAHYLRLLVRLNEDPDVDNTMRAQLHCAEPLVTQGLHVLAPRLDANRLDAAWLLASAPLYAAILNHRDLSGDDESASVAGVAGITHCFVLAGLQAYLRYADTAPARAVRPSPDR